ncbi:MAG: hypothetical protein R3F59_32185 [Myxococcota bacterium]
MMSSLRSSEQLYLEGRKEEATEAFIADESLTAQPSRPAPRPVAPAPPPEPPPQPKPPASVDRSPRRASSPGDLDDLFGGNNEGRVRVGRRTVRQREPEE